MSLALESIRSAILSGDSVEKVRETIENDSVLAPYLKQFIPQNLDDLKTLLVIIGIIYGACKILSSSPTPEQLLVPKPVAEIVNKFSEGAAN